MTNFTEEYKAYVKNTSSLAICSLRTPAALFASEQNCFLELPPDAIYVKGNAVPLIPGFITYVDKNGRPIDLDVIAAGMIDGYFANGKPNGGPAFTASSIRNIQSKIANTKTDLYLISSIYLLASQVVDRLKISESMKNNKTEFNTANYLNEAGMICYLGNQFEEYFTELNHQVSEFIGNDFYHRYKVRLKGSDLYIFKGGDIRVEEWYQRKIAEQES